MRQELSLPARQQQALEDFVQRLNIHCGSLVRQVILFDSQARGDASPDSDIDVLVALTDDDPDLRSQVRRLAARISLEYDLLLSVRAVGRSQWDELARHRFPIYRAIQAEGIDLTPRPA